MKGHMRTVTVMGQKYQVQSDFVKRGTFATDTDGTCKQISFGKYITNDLTIRKAIATAFNLESFRK